jgi:sporulation protein YlmC with PRC-barrel domain
MKRSAAHLHYYSLVGSDTAIGNINRFYLHKKKWIIRYLLVGLNAEDKQHQVLIPHLPIDQVDLMQEQIHIPFSRDIIANSPSLSSADPLCVKKEQDCYRYFDSLGFWDSKSITEIPESILKYGTKSTPDYEKVSNDHIYSSAGLLGMGVQATDGYLGVLKDLVFDEESWRIVYLVVESTGWSSSRNLLLDPYWVEEIKQDQGVLFLNTTSHAVSVGV